MPCYICTTCGVQHAETNRPPDLCAVCEDERQYVNWDGQAWMTLDELRRNHHTAVRAEEPGLTGLGMAPNFAIGQRALLVQTPAGNVLWDCTSLIDDVAVKAVEDRGGISAIAISHPHFYSAMVEWSRAFGGAPIYLNAADRRWVMRPDPSIVFWSEDTHPLPGGLTLIRCGGHFEGASALHWPAGAGGRGVLLTGDSIQVVFDRRHVSFMYSYPNLIPLSAPAVRRIVAAVEPFVFDRIYGAWFDRGIAASAKSAVARSADRYVRAIGQTGSSEDLPYNR
jgi:hypothetical protein